MVGVPGQAQIIQQGIGAVHIVLGKGLRELGPIVPRGRDNGHLRFGGIAKVDDVVDICAVDRQRERLPESVILEHRAPLFVRPVHVDVVDDLAAFAR